MISNEEEKGCFYNFDQELEPRHVLTTETEKLEKNIKFIDKKLEQLDEKLNALDKSMEATFNSSWIEKYLKCLYPNSNVEFTKMFKDKDQLVNQASEIFEIDVLAHNHNTPLIIGEATNFFNEDDFKKLEKLFKVRIYFKKVHNIDVDKVYFFAFDIDESLEHKIRKYCDENNITFVKGKDL